MDIETVICEICGKYLGERIDGRLYKGGKLIADDHQYCWMAKSGDINSDTKGV